MLCGESNTAINKQDCYYLLTNFDGDTIFTRLYGDTLENVAYFVNETTDKGFLLGGYTQDTANNYSKNFLLLAIDSNGYVINTHNLISSNDDVLLNGIRFGNNLNLTTGHTKTYGGGEKDVAIYIFDDNGFFVNATTIGKLDDEEGLSCIFTSDSCFAGIGTTQSYGSAMTNILFFKINYDCSYEANNYQHYTVIEDNTSNKLKTFDIFPNPMKKGNEINVKLNIDANNIWQIKIYNIEGKEIYRNNTENNYFKVSTKYLNRGIYIIKLIGSKTVICNKFVVY